MTLLQPHATLLTLLKPRPCSLCKNPNLVDSVTTPTLLTLLQPQPCWLCCNYIPIDSFTTPTLLIDKIVLCRFTANKTQNVQLGQKINIVCPNTAIVPGVDQDHMYENIWLVDKRGFETCSLNSSNPDHELLLQCSNPTGSVFKTIAFERMTTSGHSYQPGKTYYIIGRFRKTIIIKQFILSVLDINVLAY